MTKQELHAAITAVTKKYEGWILGSIRRTYDATKTAEEGSTPLAAFILISCAIDFFAGFFCGIKSFKPKPGEASKNYKDFVIRFFPQYDPADVYNHIRCRLAHNYSIGGGVALTHLHPELHDPMGIRGAKVINFEDFFNDFQAAVNGYFGGLASDPDLQEKFKKRLPLGFADVGIIYSPARQSPYSQSCSAQS